MTFYDVHSGFGGAAAPLPKSVRDFIQEYEGREGDPKELLTTLQEKFPHFEYEISDNCILMWGDGGAMRHVWRLMKFK